VAETWRLVSKKSFIFTAKILITSFLVIDQVFRILPFFSKIFRFFTMLHVVYDPFLTRKHLFYSVHTFARIHNTTSQNIGGTDAWAVPPPQIFGGPSPRSTPTPRSPPLRRGWTPLPPSSLAVGKKMFALTVAKFVFNNSGNFRARANSPKPGLALNRG